MDSRRRARALIRAIHEKDREKVVQKVTDRLDLTLGHARIMQLGIVGSGLIASFSTFSDSVGRSFEQEKLMMLIL